MKTLAITLALAALASTGVAQAQPATYDDRTQTIVRYADLDLSRPAGAQMLLRRIRTASIRECGGRPSTEMQINAVRLHEVCVDATMDATVARVGSPILTAMYQPSRSNALVRGR